jgi:hypothetical protein
MVLEKFDPAHVAAEHIDALMPAPSWIFRMLASVSTALVTNPA